MKYAIALLTLAAACTQADKKPEAKQEPVTEETRHPANQTEVAILRSADSMMFAFKQRDWKAYAKFINPAMLKVSGGADNLAWIIKQQMQNVPDSIIKTARVEKVLQVEKLKDEMQCVVEQKIVMQQNTHRITSIAYLVGQSLDNGNSWTFFDAANKGELKPTDILPNLSAHLRIPEHRQEIKMLE